MDSNLKYRIAFCIGFLVLKVNAQHSPQDTLIRNAPLSYHILENEVDFEVKMPPLIQVAGAPQAFYTHYWEFGDGNFSFEKNPKHVYEKEGEYTVRLWNTNHYDNGKPPTSRPQQLKIEQNADQAALNNTRSTSYFKEDENLSIRINRDPLPEQEMVLITSYKNNKDYVTNGELYLFYNDRAFKDDNFILEDTRFYHGEKIQNNDLPIASRNSFDDSRSFIASNGANTLRYTTSVQDTVKTPLPLLVQQSGELYRNQQRIRFENLKPGEERHVFRTLKTTPEMLKDTSAIVTLRSIYVPDENYDDKSVKDTELEIVTSHDPNRMSSNGSFLNYRLVRFKNLKYKVKFQNDGEGPANTIRLEIDTPEMLDKNTLEILDTYPKVPICTKEMGSNLSCLDTVSNGDKLIFTFRNIYLPGTAQEKVTDRDSTKGFVQYSLKFGKDFHKKKTKSRTAIYFDKNEPIYTNYATTRFLPGISIGAMGGYIHTPNLDKSKEVFLGATLSPFKAYRGYLQSELFLSAGSFEDFKKSEVVNEISEFQSHISEIEDLQTLKNFTVHAVPLSYRYNFTNYLAMGAGAQIKLDLHSQTRHLVKTEQFYQFEDGDYSWKESIDDKGDTELEYRTSKSFTNFNTGLFVDLTAGAVRIGPSLGFRYVYNFKEPHSQLQIYAIWKF